jgi:hypothetical protein
MKKLFFIFVITTVLTLFPGATYAVENDLGLWTPVYIKLPVTDRFISQLEINPRIQENVSDFNQLLVRSSVGYQLTKDLSVWQGYAWVTNYIPKFVNENRIWQQILYEKEIGRFILSNRSRLEERFIENIHGVPIRFRNMFRMQYALSRNKYWWFVIYDEPFINIGNHFNGPQSGIDQNRFFIGLNKKMSNNVSIEGGYLMQYLNLNAPSHDRLNHNILVNLYFNLPRLLN